MASILAFVSTFLEERMVSTSEPKWNIEIQDVQDESADPRILDVTARGICKMRGQNGTFALGFFASFRSATNELSGVFTSNEVIGFEHLQSREEIHCWVGGHAEVTILPNNYCFTCSLLEITFITVDPETKEEIESKGGIFLPVEEAQLTPKTRVLAPALEDGTTLRAVFGSVVENWGCGFYYSAPTKFDATGSPIMATTGQLMKVVGMHVCWCPITRCSIAVGMRRVIEAIRKDFTRATPSSGISWLSELNAKKIQLLKQHKLEQLTSCLFISPAIDTITPIWFMRTSHAWFWTPTNPTDGGIGNWMRISPEDDLAVVGGFWDGQEPALRNITIIRYLQYYGDQFLLE